MVVIKTDPDRKVIKTPTYMLTTINNPYNPFEQYTDWLAFDESLGYYTNNYLARITNSSDELSEVSQTYAIEQAMDEIVEFNTLGIYVKVTPENWEDRSLRFKVIEAEE